MGLFGHDAGEGGCLHRAIARNYAEDTHPPHHVRMPHPLSFFVPPVSNPAEVKHGVAQIRHTWGADSFKELLPPPVPGHPGTLAPQFSRFSMLAGSKTPPQLTYEQTYDRE